MTAPAEHGFAPRARGPVRFIDTGEEGWRTMVFFGGLGTDVNAFYETEFAREVRERLQLRAISVERNGFGMTALDESLGFADAVDDVLAVLESLGVRRFAVVAISGGAPFAAALAARVPHRVLSLHLAAAAAGPLVAETGTASILYGNPRQLALDPALAHEWQLLISEPLPDLSGLYAPAFLYWGAADEVVPVEHVREWRRILPRVAALRGYPGEGHDVQYRHWEQILRDVAGVGAVADRDRRADARVISEAFITCAVTGAGDTAGRSPHVPVTPDQIADSAIEAARAGAAVVHIHVRDPGTGAGARDPALFSDAVSRIRASSDVDPVLNLTAGMGGDLVLGDADSPLPVDPAATDMASAAERLAHVEELMPEICTLDCGTMNFAAGGEYIMANTPGMLRAMARRVQELGVRPELEVFDTGHLVLVHELIEEGLIDEPPLIQLCMGIPYGAPADLATLLAMVARLPLGAVFSAFAIGRLQLPYAALAPVVGGNVRVGLEDNLYLSRGRLARNAELVERAVSILEAIGVRVLGPDEVREKLSLRARV